MKSNIIYRLYFIDFHKSVAADPPYHKEVALAAANLERSVKNYVNDSPGRKEQKAAHQLSRYLLGYLSQLKDFSPQY